MSFTVTLYFDNMVDETHFFEKEEDAIKCRSQLENRYQGKSLYRVKIERVE